VQLKEDKTRTGRQRFQKVYFIDGGIYISSVERFLCEKTMFDHESGIYVVNRSHAIDVDHLFDLEIARAMHAYNSDRNTELFNL
jgi:CMP-N-acetylneuraminic acid synthetase